MVDHHAPSIFASETLDAFQDELLKEASIFKALMNGVKGTVAPLGRFAKDVALTPIPGTPPGILDATRVINSAGKAKPVGRLATLSPAERMTAKARLSPSARIKRAVDEEMAKEALLGALKGLGARLAGKTAPVAAVRPVKGLAGMEAVGKAAPWQGGLGAPIPRSQLAGEFHAGAVRRTAAGLQASLPTTTFGQVRYG